MKTVRFSEVVKQCGPAHFHLPLVSLNKDSELKTAINGHKVLSLYQFNTGTRADYGQIGYVPKLNGQYLIFKRSLRKLAGMKVVGIKYDLIKNKERSAQSSPTKTKKAVKKAKLQPQSRKETEPEPALEQAELTLKEQLHMVLEKLHKHRWKEAERGLSEIIRTLE